MPFLYLFIARVLDSAFDKSLYRIGRGALVAVLLSIGVQTFRIWNLLDVKRGHYRQALNDMWQASGSGNTTISSDNDRRNELLVVFYSPPGSPLKSFNYVRGNEDVACGTDWFITHTQDNEEPADQQFRAQSGNNYVLFEDCPFAGNSGWRWAIYRRDAPADEGDHGGADSRL